jgi:hypothetical protein
LPDGFAPGGLTHSSGSYRFGKYAASVENDAAGSHVVTLAVAATLRMRGAGVGGTSVGGTAIGLGGAEVGGTDVGGEATGGVAAGPHAATSTTRIVNADSSFRYFISPSLFSPGVLIMDRKRMNSKLPDSFLTLHLLSISKVPAIALSYTCFILPPSICRILTDYLLGRQNAIIRLTLHT